MKITKEEAGLWNWASGSKPKLNGREVGSTNGEEARCERRPSRSYRRPSNDRSERERNWEPDGERSEKDPNVRKEPATNSRERERDRERERERERERGSDITKKRHSKTIRYNPGPLTRNPYLNFMREYRKHNTGENILDMTRQGARAWHNLSAKEKEEFTNQARRVPPKSNRKKKRRRRFF